MKTSKKYDFTPAKGETRNGFLILEDGKKPDTTQTTLLWKSQCVLCGNITRRLRSGLVEGGPKCKCLTPTKQRDAKHPFRTGSWQVVRRGERQKGVKEV